MRFAVIFGGVMMGMMVGAAARADDASGELPVDAERLPKVRSLAAALEGAQDQAGSLAIEEFLSVLPLSANDLARMNAAYPNGLHVGCSGGDCAMDGTGSAARAPLSSSSPDTRGVDVGIRDALAGSFKVSGTEQSKTVNVCNVSGVYFARSVFRKNLVNFQFVDDGSAIVARYELVGGVSGNIRCD